MRQRTRRQRHCGVVLAVGLVVTATGCAPAPPAYGAGDLTVSGVIGAAPVVLESLATTTMSVYFTVANAGNLPDTLERVEVPWARTATLHEMMDHDAMSMMMDMAVLPVPGRSAVRLAPGRMHLMMTGLARAPIAGEDLPMVLVFRRAGHLDVRVRVVTYDQLAKAFGADAGGRR